MSELPYDLDAEENCLAAFMIHPDWLIADEFYDHGLVPSDFYDFRTCQIFAAILEIERRDHLTRFEGPVFVDDRLTMEFKDHLKISQQDNLLSNLSMVERARDELARTGRLYDAGGWEFLHSIWYQLMASGRPREPWIYSPIIKELSLRRQAIVKAQSLVRSALDFSRHFEKADLI